MPSNKTLLKIALANPDLIDVIEPMLKGAGYGQNAVVKAVEDLEFEMILVSDQIRSLKRIAESNQTPGADSLYIEMLTPVEDALAKLKMRASEAVRNFSR